MKDDLNISIYQVQQLPELLHQLPKKPWSFLPTNNLRVQSYFNNPRGKITDPVLFIAESEGEMVGFRTVLPDVIFVDDKAIRFAWNSGSWTHPDFRRMGISSKILEVVREEWEDRLAFSNYAPASEELYTRGNLFMPFQKLEGFKFFIESDLEGVVSKRFSNWLGSLARPIDGLINLKKPVSKPVFNLQFEPLESLDRDFFSSFLNGKNGFLRGVDELNWIVKNQWISDKTSFEETQKKYPFSLKVEATESGWFWIRKGGEVIGFMMIFRKEDQVTVPYCYLLEESGEVLADVCYFAHNQAVSWGCSMLILAKPHLAKAYQESNLYKYKVARNQVYYFTKTLLEAVGEQHDFQIFDGDGDHVFSN